MYEHNITYFTPSMLIEYLNCPLSFYYKYIAKIQIPQKQIHLLFGGGVHEAIEKGIYEEGDPYKIFEKKFNIDRLTDEEKNLHEEYLELGKEMIKNYAEVHPLLDSMHGLNDGTSELRIKGTLINPITNEPTSLPVSGRIDRITNGHKIVEYKTSKNKWKENDLNFKIQTDIYNLWFYMKYGFLPEETVYIILLKKYKEKTRDKQVYQVLTHNSSMTELASTFEEIEILINRINCGEFRRPSGWHPKWCDCYKFEEYLNFNK